MNTAKFDLINIPLIYWEDLAGLRPTGAIDKASSLFCQHGTGEEQITAGTALSAIAFADKKLALNKFFSEMHQPETPQFAASVKHKARVLKRLGDSENQTMVKKG